MTANSLGSIAYKYTADDAYFGSGNGHAGEGAVRWEGQGWGQIFADWAEPGTVHVRATAAGQVTLDLGQMLGLSSLPNYGLEADGIPWPHTTAGSILVFSIKPGITVTLHLALTTVDAKIAILWPHGDAAVSEAKLANITAYLTFPGSWSAVPCDLAPEVTLWRALNNEPAAPVAAGARRMAEFSGRHVPVWDFNDVDVSAARDPKNKLYFSVRVAGQSYRANVWVHGVDARTYMPLPLQPDGVLPVSPNAVPPEIDARIQIVWPHGGAPVTEANLANVSADLFAHGTRKRLGIAATRGALAACSMAGARGGQQCRRTGRPGGAAGRGRRLRALGLQRRGRQPGPRSEQQTPLLDRSRWRAHLFELLDAWRGCADVSAEPRCLAGGLPVKPTGNSRRHS